MKHDEYATSDTHFSHRFMAELRGFSSIDEMDHALIRSWNHKVRPGSIVYHLGDLSFARRGRTIEILRQLNGTIRLVRGNHDKNNGVLHAGVARYFDWTKDYYESKMEDGRRIVMFHYPLMTWNRAHYGHWHIHGHSHGNLPDTGTTRTDVGVDTVGDLAPLAFDDVAARLARRTYRPVDQ